MDVAGRLRAVDDGDSGGAQTGGDGGAELAWLRRAEASGVPIAPMAVVAAEVEAAFYHLNQLVPRIETHLAHVDVRDPDEDDLEELLPEVGDWVRGHALLDEVIESFYEALAGLPSWLTVRRSGARGLEAVRGRPTLLALKRIWSADWDPEAVAARLAATGRWLPTPSPMLVHTAEVRPDVEAGRAASAALGREVGAWSDARGRLVRLTLR